VFFGKQEFFFLRIRTQYPWEDVCPKCCTLVWQGFIKGAGLTDLIKIKVEPGNICKLKVI
jgi:hypothetical protein